MNVDGTNQSVPVSSLSQLLSSQRSEPFGRGTGELRPSIPRDTYEHVREETGTPVTYADGITGRKTDGLFGDSFRAARAALEASYAAEIVDLETVVQAKGLPLLPESESTGVLSRSALSTIVAEVPPPVSQESSVRSPDFQDPFVKPGE